MEVVKYDARKRQVFITISLLYLKIKWMMCQLSPEDDILPSHPLRRIIINKV